MEFALPPRVLDVVSVTPALRAHLVISACLAAHAYTARAMVPEHAFAIQDGRATRARS